MQAFSLPREEAQDILRRAGVPDKARGETLSPHALAALADLLYERASAAGKK